MNWRQKIIDENYQGNADRFEADFADAVLEGRKGAVRWDDLVTDAVILPDLKQKAQDLIDQYLGYLPGDSVIMPFEPYLRALLNMYWQHQLHEDDFIEQLEAHLKLIRNADMRHNTCLTYDEAIYQNYDKTFAPYGYAVKSRLTRFLGYEPKLEHSLIAEMWMRNVMAHDEIQLPETMTPVDWKAITLIKYREVLLERGQTAADASPFLWLATE
ncbi:hypothetical protein IC229_28810 [Spirosoma sp. BT702]|uniref:Uncharacterized protein n=1 Tax=Spirosoma profusum TaxID=2771354 RepID=A0A926Y3Z2_9BACT|nr:hypothetical protein [Spirosoma profusum]MBD2704672.1 hypothetical protein [Spirosoma profusum]